MTWLCDAGGAPLARRIRLAARPRFTATEALAVELVVGHVHPGNLGALPPAPSVLLYKAHQLGLL